MDCPFADKCWRCSYTKAWKANGYKWPSDQLPSRLDLIMDGYAAGVMVQTYKTKKGIMRHKGIFADKIPTNSDPNGACPPLVMNRKETCKLYNAEKEKKKRHNARRSKRVDVPASVKKYVARRDKYYCYYCNRHISELKANGEKGNIDHIIPLALGGTNSESNLCYACFRCNNAKGADIWKKGCMIGKY